jgi:fructose-1-phosphate kinase PfkB-like protein
MDSTALGFAGGFPGDFIAQTLKDSDIHTNFVQVEEDTRCIHFCFLTCFQLNVDTRIFFYLYKICMNITI